MKFGKVDPSKQWFSPLPADQPIIHELQSNSGLRVHLGGTQWGVKEWVGQWYPAGTPQRGFLSAYAQQFGCVELNATHYRMFPPSKFEEWAATVPDGFVFLPKIPQSISHYRRLNHTEELVRDFTEGVAQLGSKAGPSFLQMPDNFKAEKFNDLISWIENWPACTQLAVELRHPSWFSNPQLFSDLAAFLRRQRIGMVLTDAPGRPDVLHMAVTSPDVFIRYAGWNLHALDYERINQWSTRYAQWEELGVQNVYLGIHQSDSILTPETAIAFQTAIKKASESIIVHGVPSPLSLL